MTLPIIIFSVSHVVMDAGVGLFTFPLSDLGFIRLRAEEFHNY